MGDLWISGDLDLRRTGTSTRRPRARSRGAVDSHGRSLSPGRPAGFYWYGGRSDDMLKVGGLWVSPIEVETALQAHAAVHECAVVGREDGDALTKPMAFVVLRAGAEAFPRWPSSCSSSCARRCPTTSGPDGSNSCRSCRARRPAQVRSASSCARRQRERCADRCDDRFERVGVGRELRFEDVETAVEKAQRGGEAVSLIRRPRAEQSRGEPAADPRDWRDRVFCLKSAATPRVLSAFRLNDDSTYPRSAPDPGVHATIARVVSSSAASASRGEPRPPARLATARRSYVL